MDKNLETDANNLQEILSKILDESANFLQCINNYPVGILPPKYDIASLPTTGIGANNTLEIFKTKYLFWRICSLFTKI
ncbi:hypothetical protein NIES4074_59070 [Cylindrospermum sp. NIES-4074]|nr:hypothetical protein NIES4074_59070 [Cylindrospermum sp. NIES-4074]